MGRGYSMPNGFNMQGLMRQAQKMQEKIRLISVVMMKANNEAFYE